MFGGLQKLGLITDTQDLKDPHYTYGKSGGMQELVNRLSPGIGPPQSESPGYNDSMMVIPLVPQCVIRMQI